ncbi:hypothetical protein DFQ04_1971 [Algoriphagus boseongensis]|uniref:Uncharacterized protein n=1 Tax=Algoriphagus boseongensis TaxID=1442587 RepID=A0A4R6T5N3_9BACT|nr:hypothetical protein DFQ04_1971 [Algoriphagus boseongensis]
MSFFRGFFLNFFSKKSIVFLGVFGANNPNEAFSYIF